MISTQITVASEEEEEEDNFWDKLKCLTKVEFKSFNSFVTIDDNESIEYEKDLSDNEIVEEVVTEDINVETIQLSTEEQEDYEEIPIISNSQAMKSIDCLQRYFGQIGVDSVGQQLIQIQSAITINTFKSLKQTKITHFFA